MCLPVVWTSLPITVFGSCTDWVSGRPLLRGEGSQFFVLSARHSPADYAVLRGVSCCYKPSQEDITAALDALLEQNGLRYSDISPPLYGRYQRCPF